jgi:vacuolar-type H+-ATPase subunit H
MGMDTKKATEETGDVPTTCLLLGRWRYPTEPDAVDISISAIAVNICEKSGLERNKSKINLKPLTSSQNKYIKCKSAGGAQHIRKPEPMDAKDALAKIKAAEQKAEQDVQQSRSQAGDILKAAQRESERLLNAARKKARADGEKFQVQSETEVRDEISHLEKETGAKIRKIKERAVKTGDKALDFIIAKLTS